MERDEIIDWLRCEEPERLEQLWQLADETRRVHVGEEVHLRGLIEISSYCRRNCAYCGLNVANVGLQRYRMEQDEILVCAVEAAGYGYGTVVLQSGEDLGISCDWMEELIRRIKSETSLAVTLSLGERDDDELVRWRNAGADRYLLRFETSDCSLYERIHPSLPGTNSDRIQILRRLRLLGYEVGSGVMIGIPGQTYSNLADDILLFRELDLDMIGVGPYISHTETPAGRGELPPAPDVEQVPNSELMTYKVIALTRLNCPGTNIPSTTALATLNPLFGRELGLQRGANVVMPNMTPRKYRALYEIYPSKACIDESAADCRSCMTARIHGIGRSVGRGRGDSSRLRK